MTSLIPFSSLQEDMNIYQLHMKDEGTIPTGSFKARGAAVGVSKAKELGIKELAMPTNANTGAAWSLYASRASMNLQLSCQWMRLKLQEMNVLFPGKSLPGQWTDQ